MLGIMPTFLNFQIKRETVTQSFNGKSNIFCLLLSHSVMSNFLWPHELQHVRLPCSSPSPELAQIHPLSQWWYSSISSILCHPLLFLPSIFPSIRVFSNESALHIRWPSTGASASPSVLSMDTQNWFPLGFTGFISLQSKGFSRIFSNTVQRHQFFATQSSLQPSSHIHTWRLEKP